MQPALLTLIDQGQRLRLGLQHYYGMVAVIAIFHHQALSDLGIHMRDTPVITQRDQRHIATTGKTGFIEQFNLARIRQIIVFIDDMRD